MAFFPQHQKSIYGSSPPLPKRCISVILPTNVPCFRPQPD